MVLLLRRGYLLPKHGNFPSDSFDSINFELTPRGRMWAEGGDLIPDDPYGYMRAIRGRIPAIDPVIEQYLDEGVNSFHDEHFFAAAVMIGAAAEKSFYNLAEALRDSLVSSAPKTNLEGQLRKREFGKLRDLVFKIIQMVAALPTSAPDIFRGATTQLNALYEDIQFQRNDAVHPRTASFTEQGVFNSYLAFSGVLATTEAMVGWFRSRPNTVAVS